jgi:hypothetical protein
MILRIFLRPNARGWRLRQLNNAVPNSANEGPRMSQNGGLKPVLQPQLNAVITSSVISSPF